MFGGTRRYYRGITGRIRVLQNLSLYGSTCKYYKTYTDLTELILVLRNLFLYGCTRRYYLFKYPKRRTLVLISILSYTHTGVPVGTTEFILIRSLHGGTHRYYRDSSDTGVPVGTSELIFVQRYLVSCTCTTEPILVLWIFYLYYRVYFCISDLILVLRSIYMYFGFYTCITELILVFQIIYMSYRAYTCLTNFILVLQN